MTRAKLRMMLETKSETHEVDAMRDGLSAILDRVRELGAAMEKYCRLQYSIENLVPVPFEERPFKRKNE